MGRCLMKFLKFCCIATFVLLLIMAATFVALYFTILKPKKPEMVMQPVALKGYRLTSIFPPILNMKLGVTVTVNNHNYGSFKYENGTTYIKYRETVVAEALIKGDTLPARGKLNVSTTVNLSADRMASNQYFITDCHSGWLNLTSTTTLHGEVKVLKLFKMKATTYSKCDISIDIKNQTSVSVCDHKINY
ncbi:hypothetical protein MLD38_036873 [Melastoma candidum]|uniref:Uncharacterized protein n=1 Tax=Melastoma candidum TaxID=119954 RepID=A0ACB9LKZ2_9MYRT|nr:hypothetical protein MLD38_036873 [Melastoma candidum]